MTEETSLIGDWSGRRCPECNAETLANEAGDEWCSYVCCAWGKDVPDVEDQLIAELTVACAVMEEDSDAGPAM